MNSGSSDAVVEWFDSHCHIQSTYLTEADTETGPHAGALESIMARASEAGVTRMICIGTDATTSAEAVGLVQAMQRPESVAVAEGIELWATIGLHPHDAVHGIQTLDTLLDEAIRQNQVRRTVVGIGECGLDYHYDHSPRDVQRTVFSQQIELANRFGLALVVHTREAWDDTFDILQSTGVPERTVIHCFTGGPAEARRCLDLGAFLSFSGVVTFKSATEVREAAQLCPLDRMLVETDSPFLTPVPHRGSPNEPARVPLVGAAIAAIKGVGSGMVAEAATANTRHLFGC